MAPSSALASAPASESRPPAIQAASTSPGFGSSLAMAAGVRKMPEPITDDTTSMVVSYVPNSRASRSRGSRPRSSAPALAVAATSAP